MTEDEDKYTKNGDKLVSTSLLRKFVSPRSLGPESWATLAQVCGNLRAGDDKNTKIKFLLRKKFRFLSAAFNLALGSVYNAGSDT